MDADEPQDTAAKLAGWVNEGQKDAFGGARRYLPGDPDDEPDAKKARTEAPDDDSYMAASFVQEPAQKPEPKKRRRMGMTQPMLAAAARAAVAAAEADAAADAAAAAAADAYDPFLGAYHGDAAAAPPSAADEADPGDVAAARTKCRELDVGANVGSHALWPRALAKTPAEVAWDSLSLGEQNRNVQSYLRSRHFYCAECKRQFEDEPDVRARCPHSAPARRI